MTRISTNQRVSSTVRSLADESFEAVVVEKCRAAGTEKLHRNELTTINMIYCHVVRLEDIAGFLQDYEVGRRPIMLPENAERAETDPSA